jgi:hypothetical protein
MELSIALVLLLINLVLSDGWKCINHTQNFCKFGLLDSTEVPKGIFQKYPETTNFDLNNLNISRISKEIFLGVENLESFNIGNNKLKIIGDTFSNLITLKQLDLSHNEIEMLNDKTFEGSLNLEVLNLNGNEIFEIDGAFGALKQLRNLDLGSNKIMDLNDEVFNDIHELRSLNLSSNLISLIDAEIFINLEKLEVLDLSQNSIICLDDSLISLTHLKKLTIFSNKIHKINSKSLEKLQFLEEIQLDDNGIQFLANETFINNLNLKKLSIGKNEIKFESATMFNHLSNLSYLNVKDNGCIDKELSENLTEISNILENCVASVDDLLIEKDYWIRFQEVQEKIRKAFPKHQNPPKAENTEFIQRSNSRFIHLTFIIFFIIFLIHLGLSLKHLTISTDKKEKGLTKMPKELRKQRKHDFN